VFTGRIALARGDVETAASAAGTAAELLRGSRVEDQHQFPLGVLEIGLRLAVAGPAAALDTTAQVVEGYELAAGSPRYAWPLVAEAALVGVAAVGDERLRSGVASLAGRLRTIAEKLETFGPAQEASRATFFAADAQLAGLLAGDAGGVSAWDEAAGAWAGVSEPYPRARALLHAAEGALAGGDREGAADRLREAAALAAGLGAGSLAGEIALLARRGRIVLDSSSAAGAAGFGLTSRELEVLRLVAAGCSNRDIANELFISPKTASVHVSNILGKLGAASRGEAAAKAHTLQLVAPAL
jgi:DNA-binding CsgD family transcriptional regulator